MISVKWVEKIPVGVKIIGVMGLVSAVLAVGVCDFLNRRETEKLRHKIVWDSIELLKHRMQQGLISERLRPDTYTAYFLTQLPARKQCFTNALREGCWQNEQGHLRDIFYEAKAEESFPGLILKNGTVLVGFESVDPELKNQFFLDWNGVQGPNRIGEDQLFLEMCIASKCGTLSQPGSVTPAFGVHGPKAVQNEDLYTTIFRQAIF